MLENWGVDDECGEAGGRARPRGWPSCRRRRIEQRTLTARDGVGTPRSQVGRGSAHCSMTVVRPLPRTCARLTPKVFAHGAVQARATAESTGRRAPGRQAAAQPGRDVNRTASAPEAHGQGRRPHMLLWGLRTRSSREKPRRSQLLAPISVTAKHIGVD